MRPFLAGLFVLPGVVLAYLAVPVVVGPLTSSPDGWSFTVLPTFTAILFALALGSSVPLGRRILALTGETLV